MTDESKKQTIDQKVGGYGVTNLIDSDIFLSKNDKVVNLSFEIKDIVEIDKSEILKLLFFNGLTVRIMKYENEKNQSVATFDVIDEKKKEIVAKSNKEFVRGLGISEFFYSVNMITQWEILVLTRLCLGFIHGDTDILKDLIKNHHLKFSKESEWYLKMKLGVEQ